MDTPLSTPLTIIVVEDNPVDVYLIRWVLTAHELPYTLHVIDNADQAMHYIDELAQQDRPKAPTIMLLDLTLPQRTLGKHLCNFPDGTCIALIYSH